MKYEVGTLLYHPLRPLRYIRITQKVPFRYVCITSDPVKSSTGLFNKTRFDDVYSDYKSL